MNYTSPMQTKTNGRSLPEGWQWVKLGDVCEIIMGQSPEGNTYNNNGEGMPLLNGPSEFGSRYPTAIQWTISPIRFAEKDDILFCVRGATTGRKNIANQKYCIGRGLAAIRAIQHKTDIEFLYYLLDIATAELLKETAGSIFPNLSGEKLQNFIVPLPPIDEQQRIAGRLNEQLAAVESARKAAEEQLQAAWELPSAYLREVFTSDEAKKWHKQPLAEVSEIVSGITLGRKLDGIETRKVPYLRVANVKDGYLDLSDVYDIDATDADIKKCTLKYGDLLLTEGGDPDKLGRGTFWEEQIPECLHQNHIFRVRFDLEKFFPQFVAHQVGSSYGKAYFLAHAKQTTGIATINQKVLGNFPLLIPTYDEQKRIAETLKNKIGDADRLSTSLESQLAEIEGLPASLLREAFGGNM